MFGQNVVNHTIAMRMYHAHYCNRAYRTAISSYIANGEGRSTFQLQDYQFGMYISDAALECCGHEAYQGAVSVAIAIAAQRGKKVLSDTLFFLERFATLEHIASLDTCSQVKR